MDMASNPPRQRPSSERPHSHLQPSSGQPEHLYQNGRSYPWFSWQSGYSGGLRGSGDTQVSTIVHSQASSAWFLV